MSSFFFSLQQPSKQEISISHGKSLCYPLSHTVYIERKKLQVGQTELQFLLCTDHKINERKRPSQIFIYISVSHQAMISQSHYSSWSLNHYSTQLVTFSDPKTHPFAGSSFSWQHQDFHYLKRFITPYNAIKSKMHAPKRPLATCITLNHTTVVWWVQLGTSPLYVPHPLHQSMFSNVHQKFHPSVPRISDTFCAYCAVFTFRAHWQIFC